jgi:arginase family enzyme
MTDDSTPVIGPVDGRVMPRFAGAATFARLPEIDRVTDYDVALLGIPFDSGTSYRPGARFGPTAVRQASRHLRPGHHVELDCEPLTAIQVADAGDVPVTPFSIDSAIAQIGSYANDVMSGGRTVVAIGGDHTVALPMLRSVVREHGPVALVHLDPSFAPGTGTPEVGGLTSRELLRVLRGLTGLHLVGADVVEVAPAYDHAEVTALAAATVIFDIITLLARARNR